MSPEGRPTSWRAERSSTRWWGRRPIHGLIYDAHGALIGMLESAELAQQVVDAINTVDEAISTYLNGVT